MYYVATPEPSPRLFSMAALQPFSGASESALAPSAAPCPGARRRNCECGCSSRCGGRGLGDSSQLMSVIGGGQPGVSASGQTINPIALPVFAPGSLSNPVPSIPNISLPGDLGGTLSPAGGGSSTLSQMLSVAPSLASSAIRLANQAAAPGAAAAAPAASTSFLSGSTFGISNGTLLVAAIVGFAGIAILKALRR